MKSSRLNTARPDRGFTLIEVMIVVAILGIMAAIAIPSYSDYAKRARRAEGMTALTEMANLQERHFSNEGFYSVDNNALPYPGTTEKGMYLLSIVVNATVGYQLTATPNPLEAQTGDGDYRLTASGLKTWDKANDSSFGYDWTDR